jgi:L-asparaginase
MVQLDNSKIVILGTGGTIAGTAAQAGDNIGYRAAQVGVDQLIRSVASLSSVLGEGNLVTEQVAQVDSKDMGFAVWRELALRCAHWLADHHRQSIPTAWTRFPPETPGRWASWRKMRSGG